MKARLILMFVFGVLLQAVPAIAADGYSQAYSYYMDAGRRAVRQGDLQEAIENFNRAHLLVPSAQEPLIFLQKLQSDSRGPDETSDAGSPDFPQGYAYYIVAAKKAFRNHDYQAALELFDSARQVAPSAREPQIYINLIKRYLERRTSYVYPQQSEELKPVIESYTRTVPETVEEQPSVPTEPPRAGYGDRQSEEAGQELDQYEKRLGPVRKESAVPPAQPSARPPVKRSVPAKTVQTASVTKQPEIPREIYLNDDVRATQPRTLLQVVLNSTVIIEGREIQKFLAITPDVIQVERLDRDRLRVKGLRRATTIFHVWDQNGRWTFNVDVILATTGRNVTVAEKGPEEYAKPFRFHYGNDYGAYYYGDSFNAMHRRNLSLIQTWGLEGETPFGDLDASAASTKFPESTEVTNYTAGLSDIPVRGASDVNGRIYDASKSFTPLSLPGQYFRGGLVEGKTLNNNLGLSYIQGQDHATFTYLSPGVSEWKRSYIQGGQVVLFPNDPGNQYSLNYARGYGEQRPFYLPDQVYSVEGRHRFKDVMTRGEVASDSNNNSEIASVEFQRWGWQTSIKARDIDKDFNTITGPPSNQGEAGGTISLNGKVNQASVNTNLDFYRDRLFPNQIDPHALNYNLDSDVEIPLDAKSEWGITGYYLNTPGELAPQRNARLGNTYTRHFTVWGNRDLTAFVGNTLQRSRSSFTPASEYDRSSLSTGFRIMLIKNLSYYANYEYAWLHQKLDDKNYNPNVFNTGAMYSLQLTRALSSNIGFYYRNEQNTEATNSFLAGEDSITGTLGLNYRASDNFEVFTDGRVRNVWAARQDNPSYNEVDVRAGVRMGWDTPVSWNPSGIVEGFVYKDVNNNQRRDPLEPGLPGVKMKIGKMVAVTDSQGHYRTVVRAKKVRVIPDIDTIPSGYIFSTPSSADVTITSFVHQRADFGLSTQSGIYGIVYVDKNENGKPDRGDVFVPRARLVLDGQTVEMSDAEGTYFFKNIAPGPHQLRIDVNALPMQYLPMVKLDNKINVTEGTTYILHVPLKVKAENEEQESGEGE